MIAQADLVVPDGAGVVWALGRQGVRVRRSPGIELAWSLLSYAEAHHWSVALVGGSPEVMECLKTTLARSHPRLRLLMAEHGFQASDAWSSGVSSAGLRPDLVLVALGVPRQEVWAKSMRQSLPGLWMGVGGSFDVWSGLKQRAPEWTSRCRWNGCSGCSRTHHAGGVIWCSPNSLGLCFEPAVAGVNALNESPQRPAKRRPEAGKTLG